jgi:hypothetical protein
VHLHGREIAEQARHGSVWRQITQSPQGKPTYGCSSSSTKSNTTRSVRLNRLVSTAVSNGPTRDVNFRSWPYTNTRPSKIKFRGRFIGAGTTQLQPAQKQASSPKPPSKRGVVTCQLIPLPRTFNSAYVSLNSSKASRFWTAQS